MDYKLAKQLKNKGFPQELLPKSWFYNVNGEAFKSHRQNTEELYFKIPTLSELISACGEGFGQLGAATEGFNVWQLGIRYPVAFGKTPEIAVANLWLKLN